MSLLYYLFVWILFCTGVAMLFVAIRVFFIEEEEYIYNTGQLRRLHVDGRAEFFECFDCESIYGWMDLVKYFLLYHPNVNDDHEWYCPKCKENRHWEHYLGLEAQQEALREYIADGIW